jgi:Transposase DDE domain
VGYNVQVAVDTKHHLIVTHEVTNVGNDRSQLAGVAKQTKDALETESLDVVADRGYFNSAEILACEKASITVTLPKPMTSNAKADGRFGKQDFRYVADEDVYICPADETLAYHYTNEENGLVLRRYWTNACQSCAIKHSCTPSKERRITRWCMSMFSKPCSAGSTSTRKRCAGGAKRSSVRSGRSRRGWEQPTS